MNILLDVTLTLVIYLIFPVLYRLSNGKVSNKHGKKLALINSIVCAIIFCIIRASISGGEHIVASLSPAVVWYFIVKAILVDKKIEDESDFEEDESDFEEEQIEETFYNNETSYKSIPKNI